jgi:hypothetical protein
MASKKIYTVQNVRSERVLAAGPRGFRFGKAWTKAVKSIGGIAVHPVYLQKLKAHAKAVGVSAAGKDPVAICQRVAAAI